MAYELIGGLTLVTLKHAFSCANNYHRGAYEAALSELQGVRNLILDKVSTKNPKIKTRAAQGYDKKGTGHTDRRCERG